MEANPAAEPYVGRPVNRADGRAKITGEARYTADVTPAGCLYAVLVGSAVAKGRVRSIDVARALAEPGVVAVLTHENLPRISGIPRFGRPMGQPGFGQSFMPMQGPDILYIGQYVAVAVADTLERAQAAARRIEVAYDTLEPPSVGLDGASFRPAKIQGVFDNPHRRGDLDAAFAGAPVTHEASYRMSTNHHNPMETSATVALWEGRKLTLWDSNQGVGTAQRAVSDLLGLPPSDVRVISEFVGGGFGCKGFTWPHEILTALAAKVVRRPVKTVLSREQMYTACGYREERVQALSLAAEADGRLRGIRHRNLSPTSAFDDWSEPAGEVVDMAYALPAYECVYDLVRVNTHTPNSMRAPGLAAGAYALESALNELAERLDLDPLEIRRRNFAATHPANGLPWSSNGLLDCFERGARRIGWERRSAPPGTLVDAQGWRVGLGMASAFHPVYPPPVTTARARVFADGSAVFQAGTTDIGQGTYTIFAQIGADALGLPLDKVRVEIGDSDLPNAILSGGSRVAASAGSAVHDAGVKLRHRLADLAVHDERSPLRGLDPARVAAAEGRLFDRADPARGEAISELMQRRRVPDLEAMGSFTAGPERQRFSMYSFGAAFVEVRVDPDTGLVRVSRVVGVYDTGRVLNAKTARSQAVGGLIWGLSQALFEHTAMDRATGRYVNANLAEYLLPVNADVPEIEVEFVELPDPHVNPLGAKAMGELSIVGVAAAVTDAVWHATGRRVRALPVTPESVMAGA